jgi:hypothetical protein
MLWIHAGPSGRAVWGEGLDRLNADIVGLSPTEFMSVFPLISVLSSCVGTGLCDGQNTRPGS